MLRREANDPEIEYLKMIQAIIDRMARCSFLIKGWTVAVTTAVLALNATARHSLYSSIGLVPILFFWALDSYYLRQERLFRALYGKAISELDFPITERSLPLFSMNTTPLESEVASWIKVAISRTIWPFYCALLAAVLIIALAFNDSCH